MRDTQRKEIAKIGMIQKTVHKDEVYQTWLVDLPAPSDELRLRTVFITTVE